MFLLVTRWSQVSHVGCHTHSLFPPVFMQSWGLPSLAHISPQAPLFPLQPDLHAVTCVQHSVSLTLGASLLSLAAAPSGLVPLLLYAVSFLVTVA